MTNRDQCLYCDLCDEEIEDSSNEVVIESTEAESGYLMLCYGCYDAHHREITTSEYTLEMAGRYLKPNPLGGLR